MTLAKLIERDLVGNVVSIGPQDGPHVEIFVWSTEIVAVHGTTAMRIVGEIASGPRRGMQAAHDLELDDEFTFHRLR